MVIINMIYRPEIGDLVTFPNNKDFIGLAIKFKTSKCIVLLILRNKKGVIMYCEAGHTYNCMYETDKIQKL